MSRSELENKKNKVVIRSEKEIDECVNKLMAKMTLKEKIGQLTQTFYYSDIITGPVYESNDTIKDIKNGDVGSILNQSDPKKIYALQKTAVEESRLHIPLMFMLDVIHGFKTSFPTPLSMACSFDYNLIKKVAKISAYEAVHSGVNVTFSPMLDLVNDARWGRVNESNGEDPYLNACLAKAYVKGYQGRNLANLNSIGSCCKHFVGYGACIGGRDYNRVDMSMHNLYQNYLPSFQSAIDNGVLGVMYGFHALNNYPMTCNKSVTVDILRDEMKFKGFSISDYGAALELIKHKVAKDEYDVTKLCIAAGLDQEMATNCYKKNLYNLCQKEKKYIKLVNKSCFNILKAKYQLGLFDNPYRNIYEDYNKYMERKDAIKTSYEIACKSIVMLKNENLPLKKKTKIALFGPYSNEKEITGPWGGISDRSHNITINEAFLKENDVEMIDNEDEKTKALQADVCILCLGEELYMSGEAGSRVNLDLPKKQEELLDRISKINQNIVLIIFSGRPLVLTPYLDKCKSILFSFYLGMQGGSALKDIILGNVCPSGKLAMSMPYHVGQEPLTYQEYPTGRPVDENATQFERFKSHYLDCSNKPLFPFSYGLTFNNYVYQNFDVSKTELIGKKDKIEISYQIKNEGKYDGEETSFMFIESKCFSITRPYNELKGFHKIKLSANEVKKDKFVVSYDTLKYLNNNLKNSLDDGEYLIKIGSNLNRLYVIQINYKNK